jgi:hypothetical protein
MALRRNGGSQVTVRRSETIVPVCRLLRIRVWLAALAILIVISRGAACATDGQDPHLRSLDDYLAEGILEDSLLGLTLREDRRDLKSGGAATGLLIVAIREGRSRRKGRIGRSSKNGERNPFWHYRNRIGGFSTRNYPFARRQLVAY